MIKHDNQTFTYGGTIVLTQLRNQDVAETPTEDLHELWRDKDFRGSFRLGSSGHWCLGAAKPGAQKTWTAKYGL